MEARIRNALETLQKQSASLSAQHIQSQLFEPIQLQEDEALKEEILHYAFEKKGDMEPLLHRIWGSYQQQQRAKQVFALLDEAGKGVVVLHDLQRVAKDLLDVPEDDLEEMIREFDQTGDGLLYPEDIVRIARLVELDE